MPPLAQPVGGILAGQAVAHVLSARRWAEVSDEMRDYLSGVVRHAAATPWRPRRPRTPSPLPPEPEPDIDDLRARGGVAASEEDLLLVALFGEDADRLLRGLRGRGGREDVGGRRLTAPRGRARCAS